ncbi:hypothetical protein ABTB91_20085, partial [Acinetobacter baumannii]
YLTATGSGTISAVTIDPQVSGGEINMVTGGGNIGSSSTPINVNAFSVNAETNSTGDVFVANGQDGESVITTGTGTTGSVHDLT